MKLARNAILKVKVDTLQNMHRISGINKLLSFQIVLPLNSTFSIQDGI